MDLFLGQVLYGKERLCITEALRRLGEVIFKREGRIHSPYPGGSPCGRGATTGAANRARTTGELWIVKSSRRSGSMHHEATGKIRVDKVSLIGKPPSTVVHSVLRKAVKVKTISLGQKKSWGKSAPPPPEDRNAASRKRTDLNYSVSRTKKGGI